MKTVMTTRCLNKRPVGFVLLVTLIVLVVLSALMAGLATRLTMAKRRQQYMIEYQRARYGLDSGLKFILSEVSRMNFRVESRQGEPDFSDLFWMDQYEYTKMIAEWAAEATEEQIEAVMKEGSSLYDTEPVDLASIMSKLNALFPDDEEDDASEPNLVAADNTGQYASKTQSAQESEDAYYVELDPNDIEVPGPYGVPWPNVVEPIEMEVGDCKVTITIEDENAKLPLSWMVVPMKEDDNSTRYALETFLEWMAVDSQELKELEESLDEQLKLIRDKKQFKLDAGNILVKASRSTGSSRFKTVRTRDPKTGKIVTKRVPVSSSKTRTSSKTRPAVAHRTDFAKLFHSSLLDHTTLNTPRTDRGSVDRVETIEKYIGLWGSQRVNVNTAPRHVLLAAFAMAMTSSEAVETADQVIIQRQEKPFKKTDEIKEVGLLDGDTYNRLKNYITTESTFFKIRVTSRSGNAGVSAVAAVVKEKREVQTLMVLYGF